MLTLRKLALATPRPIMLRALMQCRVTITRAIEDVDDYGNPVKECAGLIRATDGDRFAVIMFYEPDKKNIAESKVWAHCSCPYYTFHVEVVNALKRSSDVINSNGELPVIRNPRMVPHLCKHLIALGKLALAAKYKAVGRKKKLDQDKAKQGKTGRQMPPSKTLKRPGEIKPLPKPGQKKPAAPKPGPKPPQKTGVRLGGPKAPPKPGLKRPPR